MYCTCCGRFLGDRVKTCDYCGAAQHREHVAPPVALPRSNGSIAIVAVALSGVIALMLVVVLAFTALVSPFGFGTGRWDHWDHSWLEDDWDVRWRDWYEPVLAQDLLDSQRLRYKDISVSGNVVAVVPLDAVYIYGIRAFRYGVALHLEDESGLMVVLIDADFTEEALNIVIGNQARFFGWFWNEYELDDNPVPVISAHDWDMIAPS